MMNHLADLSSTSFGRVGFPLLGNLIPRRSNNLMVPKNKGGAGHSRRHIGETVVGIASNSLL